MEKRQERIREVAIPGRIRHGKETRNFEEKENGVRQSDCLRHESRKGRT